VRPSTSLLNADRRPRRPRTRLYPSDAALDQLAEWLPSGDPADDDDTADAASVLGSADRSALVTVTHYTTQGSAEVAGESTDLVLASHDDHLHSFTPDRADRTRLVARPLSDNVRGTVASLLT
jgi:hypothetical protein